MFHVALNLFFLFFVSFSFTYQEKLYARAMKVAYYMLNKLGGGKIVSPGTTVALVFRNDEANAFVTAFYGCILAGVIPVALEPPLTREVSLCVWCNR